MRGPNLLAGSSERACTCCSGILLAYRKGPEKHLSSSPLRRRHHPTDGRDRGWLAADCGHDRNLQRRGDGAADVARAVAIRAGRQDRDAGVLDAGARTGAGADGDHGGGTQFHWDGERTGVDEGDRADRRHACAGHGPASETGDAAGSRHVRDAAPVDDHRGFRGHGGRLPDRQVSSEHREPAVLVIGMARAGVERRDAGAAQTAGIRADRFSDGLLLQIAHDGWNTRCGPVDYAGDGGGDGTDFRAGSDDHQGVWEPGWILMTAEALTPVLRFEDVTVSFDGEVALREISFEAFEGESRIILGAAGSGKTVLLKTAMGLKPPESGKVVVFGRDISTMSEKLLFNIRSKIGMLFEEGALFDSLNIAENVAYPLLNQPSIQCPKDETLPRGKQTLEFVELGETLEKFPSELSGGMRRRAAIARAVVTAPPLQKYDSPTCGLCPSTAHRLIA